MSPLAIDLFCGLGGWTSGLLAEGYRVIGFDIERHAYGDQKYPAQLVLQDVLTIHGSQFKGADLIVASPPCQEFSHMAMPWTRAKQIARALRGEGGFPEGYRGSRTLKQLTALFDACFRIQREASEAAGRHIPMVVENVRGAQPWVGKARANYGSFYLWGDVPALMPVPHKARKVPGFRFDGSGGSFQTASVEGTKVAGLGAGWPPPGHPDHKPGISFNGAAERATKNEGGSWFAIGSPGQKVTGQNPVHDAVKGFKDFHDSPICAFGSKSSARKAAFGPDSKDPRAPGAVCCRLLQARRGERGVNFLTDMPVRRIMTADSTGPLAA